VTILLAHPTDADLDGFVEGTLPEAERDVVVHHIADCDDCRVLVVDAAEFIEPAKVERHSSWWMQIAAALILVAAIGALTFNHFRDPLAKVEEAYARVPSRPLEARLSGFPYVRHVVNRGVEDEDPQLSVMKGLAADAMELKGDDAKTIHARGIGFLLGDDPKKSIALLQSAVDRDPNNAKYQSDLAAALIAARNPQSALAATDRALRIDPNFPDALFNRAVALQALARPEAVAAYDRYLAVDPNSPWAAEAKSQRDLLRGLF
jgi:tetratricopeptide (TPR) repeat protein